LIARDADARTFIRRIVMATVGFVGLGIMGRPMLNNLLKAGHAVVAYGRTAAKLEACVAAGAERAASNREVGERAEIIFTMPRPARAKAWTSSTHQ
jgi:3-hydroxyisobutyrate dehydrogenase-like beta-hydroxyacid dehydrogenase